MNKYASLALLTDLYQLTMAYGYWKLGMADREAVFHLFFRKPPFKGGYAIAAGLAPVVEFLEEFSFDDSDIDYLATLTGNDGEPLFESTFLKYLRDLELTCDIDAMPEGTLAFGQQPLIRVKGPLLQCQILETALLNIVNFQTLIATKASRISAATGGEPVLEFGLRRAQGIDGGLAASRAAYIGGCAATSNVLAGKLYGIPVRGTHAHSWVMSFEDEQEAFAQYAEVMPNNCVFLVDTYDTLEGVRKAIAVGQHLRKRGQEMVGIRLDSGDLAYLSIEARKLLNEAGFADAVIVASNDLDEHIIESLKAQGAKIAVWGVGTKLVTAFDQPALGGVYKLGALKDEDDNWQPKLKLSEQSIKTSIPGVLQVRRYEDAEGLVEDVIYNETLGLDENGQSVDLLDNSKLKKSTRGIEGYDLLQPVIRNGKVIAEPDSIETARNRAQAELKKLQPRYRRLMNPHIYRVGLDLKLHQLRDRLITEARQPNN